MESLPHGSDVEVLRPQWFRKEVLGVARKISVKNHTTVGMHTRAVRAIINDARKAGIIKETQYPFGGEVAI